MSRQYVKRDLGVLRRRNAEYQRRYREHRLEYAERNKLENKARARARVRLAGMYPNVFKRLFEEELTAQRSKGG